MRKIIVSLLFVTIFISCGNKDRNPLSSVDYPDIESVTPVGGSYLDTLIPVIQIEFTKSMERKSVEKAFSLKINDISGAEVDGVISWDQSDKVMIFKATEKVPTFGRLILSIFSHCIDREGNNMKEDYYTNYYTGIADDFEDGDIVEWDADLITKTAAVVVTNTAYEGNKSCKFIDDSSGGGRIMYWGNQNVQLNIDLRKYKNLRWAFKCESGTQFCIFLLINSSYYYLGKTPNGDPSTYSGITNNNGNDISFSILDDNNWHLYEFNFSQCSWATNLKVIELWDNSKANNGHICYMDKFAVY